MIHTVYIFRNHSSIIFDTTMNIYNTNAWKDNASTTNYQPFMNKSFEIQQQHTLKYLLTNTIYAIQIRYPLLLCTIMVKQKHCIINRSYSLAEDSF